MERRPETDAPRAVPTQPAPVSATLALALGAGGAAARRVCGDTPTGGRTIDRTQGGPPA